MDSGRPSITALVTAFCRAYHYAHDNPKIFEDYLAGQLFTEEEYRFFNQNLAGLLKIVNPNMAATNPSQENALACVMQTYNGPITLSRSRYTEDCLEQAVKRGIHQYIILGAGLDTFAFRRPDLLKQIQVFEVDHPATQEIKHQRLGKLGIKYPEQLHFIPFDFLSKNFNKSLLGPNYDAQKPSFVSWLGVTYYLTRDVVFATLNSIIKIISKGSTVVFDYMDQEAFNPEKASKRIQLMQTIVAQSGEPIQVGFNQIELEEKLRELGYTLVENLNPAEIEKLYFQNRMDAYHAFEHVHFAKAVVV